MPPDPSLMTLTFILRGCFCKLGILFAGDPIIRATLCHYAGSVLGPWIFGNFHASDRRERRLGEVLAISCDLRAAYPEEVRVTCVVRLPVLTSLVALRLEKTGIILTYVLMYIRGI